MVIHFLQAGCSPPVVPVLQKDFPELFRSSNTEVLDQLTGEIPIQVKEYKSANKQSLGELLIAFFRYYSDFQWADIISIRTGTTLDNMMYSRVWRGPKIRIEDPTDTAGNVTRAVFDEYEARRIKNAFKLASRNLNGNASLESILWQNDLKTMNLAPRYIDITELDNFCWYVIKLFWPPPRLGRLITSGFKIVDILSIATLKNSARLPLPAPQSMLKHAS